MDAVYAEGGALPLPVLRGERVGGGADACSVWIVRPVPPHPEAIFDVIRPLPASRRGESDHAASFASTYATTLSSVIGSSRTRLPVAWYTALAIAEATPTMP